MSEVEDLSDGVSKMHLSTVMFKVNMIGSKPKEWWVDIGATRHICSDKRLFISYNEVKNGKQLYMGNSVTSAIEGKGTTVLKMTSGKEFTLNNMLYVQDICKNLISGPLLSKNGFRLVFESNKFVLTKSGMYVGKGYLSD